MANYEHIQEVGDIPPSKDAVYTRDRHIKSSFIRRFALMSLIAQVAKIQSEWSRRRPTQDDKTKIETLSQRIALLEPSISIKGMPNIQYVEIWTHTLNCETCKEEIKKIRGDLPEDSLPFDE